jgi:hypothetical protein
MARDDLIRIDSFHAEKALEGLRDVLALVPGGAKKAVYRALSKTITGMRTDTVKKVREDYNVPAKQIRERITLIKPQKGADYPRALLKAVGKMSVPLVHYGARPRVPVTAGGRRPKKGVSVQVKMASGRKVVEGSFIQTPRSGGEPQIFKRVGEEREPIRRLYGPGHLQALKDEGNLLDLQEQASERLTKNVLHEADYVLQEAGLR